jgi:hypothetical protein
MLTVRIDLGMAHGPAQMGRPILAHGPENRISAHTWAGPFGPFGPF